MGLLDVLAVAVFIEVVALQANPREGALKDNRHGFAARVGWSLQNGSVRCGSEHRDYYEAYEVGSRRDSY